MAGENSGDKVNIISAGIDTAPFEADVKRIQAAIRTLQAELRKLDKAGQSDSSRASNLNQELANQKATLASARASLKAAKDEAKAKLEVAEATQKAAKATLSYSAALGAGRVSAKQRLDMSLDQVKALSEQAKQSALVKYQEEQMFKSILASSRAGIESSQRLAQYRSTSSRAVLAEENRIQSAISATTRAREAGVAALQRYNAEVARSVRVDESAGQRAISARNAKIQEGVSYLRAWRMEQDRITQSMGRTMSVAQEMDKRLTFKRQRDEALQLFNSVKLASDQYNTLGRTVAGVKAVVDKFGQGGLAFLPASTRAYADLIPTLDQYKRRLTDVGSAARATAGHTHAAALAHDALHSAARGVSGVLGGLWLTYARMLPVLLGVAAATKLVKDSISGGLDVGFATQFAAILQTENALGRGQEAAYNNLASLRNDIRKSLIEISRESVFTVEQNAQALQKLSLAGVNAQKGLELLTTASNVAVLAQVDLGKATTMVLDTLYNFGMASESSITMAENYAKASDIMAFTANTVNASFEDIARSFENITGVAGTFNVTIEEASALLQSLAKTGIRGQKAGTYVRNFMDDLLGAPISQRAEKELDSLNIDRYNADLYGEGDFGAAKYIDDLVESLSKLGFIEQQNAIRAITNQRSRRVLRQELIEYRNGLKEVNGELVQTNSLYERTVKLQADAQGSLARMAEGLTGDTKYQFIMAQSAYNAAVNEAYLPAEPALRGAAQSLQALFRSNEFREMVTGLVTGFASLAKGAAEFAVTAMSLTKYLDGLGDVLATVAKYATALGGAFLAIKGYAAVSATIAGLGGAAAAAAAGVKLLNTALLANPAVAVGTALVATLVYLDQWYEKSKKYEQSLAGRQAKLDELREAEAEYAAQVERKQSGNRNWFDSLFPEEKLAETRAQIKSTVDSIAADMNSALDSVSLQNSFDKILNETDTFLANMRNAARQAGGDFETEYRNKLVRSIEDAQETLSAYANTVNNLDKSTEGGKQFAAFMTAWLSGISERAMIAGEELGRLNLVLSNQSLKAAAEGLEFGVKDLSQLEAANEELQKSVRALELGEDGLFLYRQEQKKTQLASLENAYAALEFSYAMATAANAPLATLEQMQAQMVATAINMSRLTDNIALSERERALQPPKRGPRPDRDPIRAQLEEARTAIQDFKNSYSEMLGSIQDSTKDLAIGPLEAYERSMRAAAEAYDQMFAAIYKAKNTAGLSANDRQKLQTDENKLLGEANKETRRLVEEYREILEDRSKNLEELEIATGRKVLGAAESWLREYANKYGETITLLQSDITNLETKLKVAVETGQSDEEVARLAAALKVLQDQLASFGKSATLGAWAADIEESIGIAEKTLESFSQTLDRMADKSSKEGLFGILSGNAAAFEATKAQYVRGLQESINEIKRKIREAEQQGDFKLKAELEIRLGNLEGSLQEASERIDPVLEGWGDSLGDYIANGIVYGFDQGESPAKAFANFLKREIYVALAQALSQQFMLNLVSVFGGGSGGASGGASGGGSSGGFGMPGIPGMDLLGMAAEGLSWLGGATGLTGLSSFAAGMGMTGYTSAAAMTALAEAGLVSGVTSGAAASAGSLVGALNTAAPYIAAATAIANALGAFKGSTPHSGAVVISGGTGNTVSPRSDAEVRALYATEADPHGLAANQFRENDFYKRRNQDVADALTPLAELAADLFNSAMALGGGDNSYRVGLGFSSDGDDKSRGRFSIIDEEGNELTDFVRKFSKDPSAGFEQFIGAVGTELRDALVAADLPAWIDDILGSLGDSVSIEQLSAVISELSAFSEQATDKTTLWQNATRSLYDEFAALGVEMPQTTAEFNKLIQGSGELGAELYALAPAFYQLSNVVDEVFASISKTTAESVRDIQLAVLDNAGKYAFLDSEIDVLLEKLSTSTDPATIQGLFEQINAKTTQAFNLLDESEQKRLAGEFVDRLYEAESLAQNRLSVTPIDYQPQQAAAVAQQAAAEKQAQAADAQIQAANAITSAANAIASAANRITSRDNSSALAGLTSALSALRPAEVGY